MGRADGSAVLLGSKVGPLATGVASGRTAGGSGARSWMTPAPVSATMSAVTTPATAKRDRVPRPLTGGPATQPAGETLGGIGGGALMKGGPLTKPGSGGRGSVIGETLASIRRPSLRHYG